MSRIREDDWEISTEEAENLHGEKVKWHEEMYVTTLKVHDEERKEREVLCIYSIICGIVCQSLLSLREEAQVCGRKCKIMKCIWSIHVWGNVYDTSKQLVEAGISGCVLRRKCVRGLTMESCGRAVLCGKASVGEQWERGNEEGNCWAEKEERKEEERIVYRSAVIIVAGVCVWQYGAS